MSYCHRYSCVHVKPNNGQILGKTFMQLANIDLVILKGVKQFGNAKVLQNCPSGPRPIKYFVSVSWRKYYRFLGF